LLTGQAEAKQEFYLMSVADFPPQIYTKIC